MLTTHQYEQIGRLIRREVVPATGCAAAVLPGTVQTAEVLLSTNMLKNAMGVGIPGTGMFGIPIAIALGIVLAAPEKQLELLDSFSDEELARAKEIVAQEKISVLLKEGSNVDKLYVEVILKDEAGHTACAVLEKTHTGISALSLDGVSCLDRFEVAASPCGCPEETQAEVEPDIQLSFDLVYEYALTAPLEDIRFIYEAALQNKRASEFSLSHNYGHALGKMLHSDLGLQFFGDTPLTQMLASTSLACDARMDGAPVTVMSNSGSGNQGISSMLPVLTFAQRQGRDEETTTRAVMMSSLLVVYVKQQLGRLSCLCGMVVSGIGTACALTYLLGGTKEQSIGAVKNMIGNVAGMICDGAKPSCSLKASTGVSSALISALLAMEGHAVTANEGIVEEDIDCCIRNLADLGRDGMAETDLKVLKIMTSKGRHG